MEQCREEIDMNWDVFSWEHHREFLYPSFTLQVALQFCFSSWLGQGEGMGRAWGTTERDLLSPQHLASQIHLLISFALVSGICSLLKQAPRSNPEQKNYKVFFPIQ